MLFPLLTGHMFPRFCPSRNKLSGTGLHHIKARVPLVHNLPLTWIHLRALACNPKQMCKLSLAGTRSMQQLPGICLTNVLHSLTGCIGAYALAIKAEN